MNEPIRDQDETLMLREERRSHDEHGCHVAYVRQIPASYRLAAPKRKGPKEEPLESTTGKAHFHQEQNFKPGQPCSIHIVCPKCGKHWETEWHFSQPTVEELHIERARVLESHRKSYGECKRPPAGNHKAGRPAK